MWPKYYRKHYQFKRNHWLNQSEVQPLAWHNQFTHISGRKVLAGLITAQVFFWRKTIECFPLWSEITQSHPLTPGDVIPPPPPPPRVGRRKGRGLYPLSSLFSPTRKPRRNDAELGGAPKTPCYERKKEKKRRKRGRRENIGHIQGGSSTSHASKSLGNQVGCHYPCNYTRIWHRHYQNGKSNLQALNGWTQLQSTFDQIPLHSFKRSRHFLMTANLFNNCSG